MHPKVNAEAVIAAGKVCRYEYETVDDRLTCHAIKQERGALRAVVESESGLSDG